MSFFRRKEKQIESTTAKRARFLLEQPVWFFLIEVRVTGSTKQPWTEGSRAMVQSFVPGRALESSLMLLDEALKVQELERIDTLRAIRYDPDDEDPDLPDEYFREPLERAARTNEATLGVFVVSEETATRADERR